MVGIGIGCCCNCQNAIPPTADCLRQTGDSVHRLFYFVRNAKQAWIVLTCPGVADEIIDITDELSTVAAEGLPIGSVDGVIDLPDNECRACVVAKNCHLQDQCCSNPPGPPPDDCCAYLRPDYVVISFPDAAGTGGGFEYGCCDIMDGVYIMPPPVDSCTYINEREPFGPPNGVDYTNPQDWWNDVLTDSLIIDGSDECFIESDESFAESPSGSSPIRRFVKWYIVLASITVEVDSIPPSQIRVIFTRILIRAIVTIYSDPPGPPPATPPNIVRDIFADRWSTTFNCEAGVDVDTTRGFLLGPGGAYSQPPDLDELCATSTWSPTIQLVTIER